MTPLKSTDAADQGPADRTSAAAVDAPAAGSPALPPAPAAAPPAVAGQSISVAFIAASLLLWSTHGLGMNFVVANTSQLQGAYGATQIEVNWLIAAYMAPNVSLTAFLVKIRTHFGLRRFSELSICIFVAASLLHLLAPNLQSAIGVRFLAGIAAAPVSTLAFFYMVEAFPPAQKLNWGFSLALFCSAATPTLARLISPLLLDIGGVQSLYVMSLGLALLCLPVIFRMPLPPTPHAKVLEPVDFVSYPLIALSFGLFAVVLVMGRLVWWLEAPWIGWCLALAILSLGLAIAIETRRATPFLNMRWVMSREILHIAAVMLIFRIVLSEQVSGSVAMFQSLGLFNEQSRGLYIVIILASLGGALLCGATVTPERVPLLHGIALLCLCTGAYMDSQATNLTRPSSMYLSQALIAFGGALFLPPAMLTIFRSALRQGPAYVTSFLVVFMFTQSVGGLMGSAVLGSFVTLREKFHSSILVEHLTLSDPVVVERMRQLSGAFGGVLPDTQLLNAKAIALLGQEATREATILAYNDTFLVIAIIAGAAFVGLILHSLHTRLRSARLIPSPAATI